MDRKGKIARLPRSIREQTNSRLQAGQKGADIVKWLNTLPEVAAIMTAEFGGQPINKINLSHWKKGGYRDWQAEQPVVKAIQSLIQRSDAHKDALSEGLSERMADFLSTLMAAQLLQLDASGNAAAQTDAVGEWLNHLARIRRAENNARRLALEQEKMELLRKKTRGEFENEFWKWAGQEHIRAQICKGRCYTEVEKRRRSRHILGIPPLEEQKPAGIQARC